VCNCNGDNLFNFSNIFIFNKILDRSDIARLGDSVEAMKKDFLFASILTLIALGIITIIVF
jgi:hypothetical protein